VSYTPGQILTAAALNASLDAKTDNASADITGGSITGLTSFNVSGTTPTTSPTTGAATVAGGVGVGGDVQVGGAVVVAGGATAATVTVTSVTDSTSTTTGAVKVAGGVGVVKNVNVGGNVGVTGTTTTGSAAVTATTQSTSATTGAAIVAGGLGVSKNANVGGALGVTGVATVGGLTLAAASVLTFADGTTQSTAGAINGELSIASTGGTATVTNAQAAANSVYVVTGALTSNIVITVPAIPKAFSVRNATTGGFSVTMVAAGQAPNVLIAQGLAGTFFSDATGVYATSITSATTGFGAAGVTTDSTGIIMNASQNGGIVEQTVAGITTQFPRAGLYPAGQGFVISNRSTGNTSRALNTAVPDTSDVPATLFPGDVYFAYSDGVSKWKLGWYSTTNNLRANLLTFGDGSVQTTAPLSNRNFAVDGAFAAFVFGAANPSTLSAALSYTLPAMWNVSCGTGGAGTVSLVDIRATTDMAVVEGPDTTRELKLSITTPSTGTVAGSSLPGFFQTTENVAKYAGKSVTISVKLKVDSGTITIPAVIARQAMGTGGSPSANVNLDKTVSWVVGTTLKKFSVRIDFPSVAGKTFGTNGNDGIGYGIWFPPGVTGNLSATEFQIELSPPTSSSDITGVGGSPTAYDDRGVQAERQRVLRYYGVYTYRVDCSITSAANVSNANIDYSTPMRGSAPAVSIAAATYTGSASAATFNSFQQSSVVGVSVVYSNQTTVGSASATVIADARL
jgi:hypothetical protein